LRLLPLFEKPNRTFVEAWEGGEKSPAGAIIMPSPVYSPDVKEFFRLAAHPAGPPMSTAALRPLRLTRLISTLYSRRHGGAVQGGWA
jgi:hypothetical protein